jgi:hypothetical protein
VIRTRPGIVTGIRRQRPGISWVDLELEDGPARGINFTHLTGPISVGQRVILNTTAVELGLGSGGWHFIIHIEGQEHLDPSPGGHIMKLRYTPLQLKVCSIEEEASPHHAILEEKDSLDGLPVIVGTLHSQLVPALVAALEERPGLSIAYIMTDGAALPISFSDTVAKLRDRGLLAGTITIGHAFGGDLEAVNIYSGLLAAKWVLGAQLAIVTMGPGTVGTGTPWGSTSLEQASILDAVHALKGVGIALLRLSFADPRERHRGISHHCLTSLARLTYSPAHVVVPRMKEGAKAAFIEAQLKALPPRHPIVYASGERGLAALSRDQWQVTTMGRSLAEDREFFQSACAAGEYGSSLIN